MELRGLGYIGIAGTDHDAWRSLLVDVLGMGDAPGPPGADTSTLWLRMDYRSWRIAVHPGERDELSYVGWELADEASFEAGVAALERAGTKVREGSEALRIARGVLDVVQFEDPFGNRHELFYGPITEETPFDAPSGGSGFLTDGVGLGHVLYAVPSDPDALDFFGGVMGFRVSDRFAWGPNGATFMRCTPRHHSLAFLDLPLPGGPGLNHFMIEALTLEDVGRAYDRAMDAGVPIVNSLGQHSNDPMLSFYVQSPAGFNIELGWKGLMVDDDTWTVRTYTGRGELWGHRGVFMDDIADAKV
ncbi:MAG: VOC family protein [Acidimicrobiales bacterium]|nr:VOC family protein [Acidimicrobiales bacterium]